MAAAVGLRFNPLDGMGKLVYNLPVGRLPRSPLHAGKFARDRPQIVALGFPIICIRIRIPNMATQLLEVFDIGVGSQKSQEFGFP